MKTPMIRPSHKLIWFVSSQLFYDGHQQLAVQLSNLVKAHPACPPSDRLFKVVKLGLDAEEGALGLQSSILWLLRHHNFWNLCCIPINIYCIFLLYVPSMCDDFYIFFSCWLVFERFLLFLNWNKLLGTMWYNTVHTLNISIERSIVKTTFILWTQGPKHS